MLLTRARDCGFLRAILGGSFPTAKAEPGDLDLLFVTPRGITKEDVSPNCAELMNGTESKERYGHDFGYCPDEPESVDGLIWSLGYDRKTGEDRGVLVIDLHELG
jgi:hypothetical protein